MQEFDTDINYSPNLDYDDTEIELRYAVAVRKSFNEVKMKAHY
jgi:hypothetical protein